MAEIKIASTGPEHGLLHPEERFLWLCAHADSLHIQGKRPEARDLLVIAEHYATLGKVEIPPGYVALRTRVYEG